MWNYLPRLCMNYFRVNLKYKNWNIEIVGFWQTWNYRLMRWSCSQPRLGYWVVSSLCSHFHPSRPHSQTGWGVPCISPYVGNSGVCWWLLLCKSIDTCRLDTNISSVLKFILPLSTINLHLVKPWVLKLEHASGLVGGLVKTQVTGPCPQNLFQ